MISPFPPRRAATQRYLTFEPIAAQHLFWDYPPSRNNADLKKKPCLSMVTMVGEGAGLVGIKMNYLSTQEDRDVAAKALKIVRNLMLNKFFIPNNIIFPKSRIILENYFN